MTIVELLQKVKETSGTNEKKALLKDNMSQLLKTIFDDTYNKSIKYYVTSKSIMGALNNEDGARTIDCDYNIFHDALMELGERKVTGYAAIERIAGVYNTFSLKSKGILLAIIDRNLKVGVSFDNFNDVLGDEKNDKYKVSLAVNITSAPKVNPISGMYFASRKLDGVRCEAHVHNYIEAGQLHQEVIFRSRQGHEFTTLDNLKDAVKSFTQDFIGDWVLDGECCIIDSNGQEDFSGIMQEITRKNHTIERPMYMLFDMITQDEFDGKTTSPNYADRLQRLYQGSQAASQAADNYIKVLKQERLTTQEQFTAWSESVRKYHWEGFMLHKDAPYKSGRSKDLLKVKLFKDAEYVVKEVRTGSMVFREAEGSVERPVISALVIEHKGTRVDVGSGLSKEQRLAWFENPQEIIGKTITVQYFSETTNKKTNEISLRFPVLKYVYENGRNV